MTVRHMLRVCAPMLAIGLLFVSVSSVATRAEERAVKIGAAYALLDRPEKPKGSIILLPGGDGHLGIKPDGTIQSLKGNQLVRTRGAYVSRNLATLTVDRDVEVAAAIAYMAKIARPVVLVATSRGSLKVPAALSAKPDAVVLTASFLGKVRAEIGGPAALPRTLVVHHRKDACHHTPPSAVEPFARWGGAKVTVAWFDGGNDTGDPCQARSYHGFNGLDADVVDTIASFALAVR